MKSKSRLLSLFGACAFAAGLFGVLLSTDSVETASATAFGTSVPVSQALRNELDVRASDGLRVVTFDAPSGKVRLHLPDDMRAGDTISGTVTAEPKGQTPEERAKNLETLNGYTITLWPNPAPKKPGDGIVRLPVKEPTFTFPLTPGTINPVFGFPGFNAELGPPIGQSSGGNPGPADTFPGTGAVVVGNLPGVMIATTTVVPPNSFVIPPLGQQGRPIVINGPFDGNASNTTLRYGPANSTIHQFVKQSDNVSDGFGLLRTLAESPRKIVFESPGNVTGPVTIFVKEGDSAPTTGTMRNVGVQLSAPKTNLLKGEKTTLTVQVSGLEGIKEPVPLTLESKGVITIEGGIYQPLMIQPSQVAADGRYTTTRGITGVQTGGWESTATVVTQRFDVCLRDESTREMVLMWNTFNGNYLFDCPTCWPKKGTGVTTGESGGKTGGKTETGATIEPADPNLPPTVPPTGLTGTGKLKLKGCILTLSHNAPDRRVFATLDACTKTGDASVETKSPKANFNITDKNTTDSMVAPPPPK